MHALEQVLRPGHSQQGQYGRAARRLTGDGDPVGVPAEAPDVVPHPFEGQQPVADGAVVRCVGDPSEAVEAEPVADRDDDHPVAVEGGAVVPGTRLGTGEEATPWIHTITGSPASKEGSGVNTLRLSVPSPGMLGSGMKVTSARGRRCAVGP